MTTPIVLRLSPRRRYALALLGMSCALLASAPADASPLTFAQALERARIFAPSIKARAVRTRAARTAADAADALPDPTLDLSLQNVPISGPDALSLGSDFMTMKTIGVRQDFPNLAKRHARLGRAEADIVAAEAGAAAEMRDVRVAAALAWVDLYYAERRLDTLDLLAARIDDLADTVAARITSGSARPSQGLEPKQLAAELADRRTDIEAEVTQAQAELTRWTGDPDPQATGAPPDWSINPDRLLAAIDALPRLQALDAATGQAEADVRLARAEKRPDWSVSAGYSKRGPNYADMVSVGVSIDLPLFAKHRQDPLIAARMDEAQAARLEREAAERQLRAQLRADLAEHRAHHERWRRATQTLVPLAEKQAELDEASYAAGRIELGTALDATVALANARIDALDREAMAVRDGIRIKLTYAKDPL
jgi:cobalt-zinc-cadmium efflux system outer membrane protein